MPPSCGACGGRGAAHPTITELASKTSSQTFPSPRPRGFLYEGSGIEAHGYLLFLPASLLTASWATSAAHKLATAVERVPSFLDHLAASKPRSPFQSRSPSLSPVSPSGLPNVPCVLVTALRGCLPSPALRGSSQAAASHMRAPPHPHPHGLSPPWFGSGPRRRAGE